MSAYDNIKSLFELADKHRQAVEKHKILLLKFAHDEAITNLKKLHNSDDTEVAHMDADQIIEKFLRECGLIALADAYDGVGKWYA